MLHTSAPSCYVHLGTTKDPTASTPEGTMIVDLIVAATVLPLTTYGAVVRTAEHALIVLVSGR